MVFSPTAALPRATTPSRPAFRAAAKVVRDTSSTSPSFAPNFMKKVPYSGPADPPTVLTRAMPTDLNIDPRGAAGSSLPRAAVAPRAMLVP